MGYRYHSAAAALFAAVVLATGSLEAMAQNAPHVPRTLPEVQRITMPQPPSLDRAAAHLLRLTQAQNAVRHTTGEEPMLRGSAASQAAQREALMRARSEQAAHFKALHPAGVDASP